MKYYSDFGFFAEFTGFRDVKFSKAEAFLQNTRKESPQDVDAQFFNPQLIASSEHLAFAVLNALEAFRNKTNISKSLAVEVMLYASAQGQIKKAIEFIGIEPAGSDIAVVLISRNPSAIEVFQKKLSIALQTPPDKSVLELTSQKIAIIKRAYGITDAMMQSIACMDEKRAVVGLVVERVALLSVQV